MPLSSWLSALKRARDLGHEQRPVRRLLRKRGRSARLRSIAEVRLRGAERLEDRALLSAAGFGTDEIVAMTGDPAPDAQGNADGTFNTFFPSIVFNDNGEAAFHASMNNTSGGFDGLFRGSTQSIVQIARDGQSVPQITGVFSGPGKQNINEPLLPFNNNNQALFVSALTGVGFDEDNGLFVGSGAASLVEIVREGDAAPEPGGGGFGGGVFNGEFTELQEALAPALNDAGQVAFADDLNNTANGTADDFGIFRADTSGSLIAIAREGQTAPGSTEAFSAFSAPTINETGRVAFAAELGGFGGWEMILRSDGASSPTVIAQVDGVINAEGDRFSTFSPQGGVPVNGAGQVAFTAGIDTGTGGGQPSGVFVGNGATITEIVRTGQEIGGGDVFFRFLDRHVALNDNGQVAFAGNVRKADGSEVFTLLRGDGSGNPVQIVNLEQRVPADDAIFFNINQFALNNDGELAFLADLLEDDGDRRDAVFFHDDARGLIEIAREGDTFNGATITNLSFEGVRATEFLPSNRDGLNKRGEVAFWFQLDNGNEGVAVVDPLPTTVINVDTFDDVVNSSDGVTSLREAVIQANSNNGAFEIRLQAGAYWLTIGGAAEDAAATGDLDILDKGSITIVGAGAGQTVINAGGDGGATPALGDRVFHVVQNGASLSVEGVTITGGAAELFDDGGGVLNGFGTTLTVTNSTLSGNSANSGGGIANFGGTLTVTNSTLSDNSANFGGGIFHSSGTLTITNSTLSGNQANERGARRGANGGGIWSSGFLTVTNSTLSGNSAGGDGGGILNVGSQAVAFVTNSTLSGNSAGIDGGGIVNFGTLTVTNGTLVGNRADADGANGGTGGGIWTSSSASTTLFNTIVAGNFVGMETTANDLDGNVETASAFNLIGDKPLTVFVDENGDDVIDVDDLADNGGPTRTHALVSGSPAIDAGDPAFDPNAFDPPLDTDQRGDGFVRVVNGRIDIGAIEEQTPAPPPPPAPELDLIGRAPNGTWWRASSDGQGFTNDPVGFWSPAAGWRDVMFEDFDGDGRTDVLGRTAGGDWWIGRNDGAGLTNQPFGRWSEGVGWNDVSLGDFSGDGLPDVVGRTDGGQWWMGRNTPGGLVNEAIGFWAPGAGWSDVLVGNFVGDARADLIGRASSGAWWVAERLDAGLQNAPFGFWSPDAGWTDVAAVDFNGDGRTDVVGRTGAGSWWLGASAPGGLANAHLGDWAAISWNDVQIADFSGDGQPDVLGRTGGGDWWLGRNVAGASLNTVPYGAWSPIGWLDVRAGDFTGDGLTDMAGRTPDGAWWVGVNDGARFVNAPFGFWAPIDWENVAAGDFADAASPAPEGAASEMDFQAEWALAAEIARQSQPSEDTGERGLAEALDEDQWAWWE